MDRATHVHLDTLLQAGRPFAIATVVAVRGSASAAPGSQALIDETGANVFGWVGGGCAERFVAEQAVEALASQRTRVVEVDLDDELLGVGMPCGGRMDVFIQPVSPPPALVVVGCECPATETTGPGSLADNIAALAVTLGWRVRLHAPGAGRWPRGVTGVAAVFEALAVSPGEHVVVATQHAGDLPALRIALGAAPASIHLVANRSHGERARTTLLDEGAPPERVAAIESPAGLDLGGKSRPEIALAVVARLEVLRHGATALPLQATRGSGPLPSLPSGWAPPELVIVGRGRICEALAALGVGLGWRVSVDGPPAGEMDRYPPSIRRVASCADFSTLPAGPQTAVIVAAHHQGDPEAIAASLRRGAPYVGLIASRHRSVLVRGALKDMGVADESLERLRAPAGLDLGGRSPNAIALAVLAEVLAVGHGRPLRRPEGVRSPETGAGGEAATRLRPGGSFRAELPLLHRPGLVWLDHASTTPAARSVIDAMVKYQVHDHGNVHRSVHRQGEAATAAYEAARARVARAVGALDARCVVFTGGCTASLNLAAHGWAKARLAPGDRVLLSAMEHHANLLPWQAVARETGAVLTLLPFDPATGVEVAGTVRELAAGARVLALSARSNVLGLAPPARELCVEARRLGVLTVVDAAQAVRQTLDVQALGCDLLAFSGHKVYGPTGIGVLVVHPERLAEGRPFLVGGGMVSRVTDSAAEFRAPPWGWEAGTPPIAEAVGLAAAFDLLERLDPAEVFEWETALTRRLLAGLDARSFPILGGTAQAEDRGGIVSFVIPGLHPHDVAELLDREGIAVGAGHHCCQPLLARLGVDACIRVSLGPANTPGQIDLLLAALDRVQTTLAR